MDSDASEFFGEGFNPQAALQQMGEGAQDGSGAQPYKVMGYLVQQHVAKGPAASRHVLDLMRQRAVSEMRQVLEARSRAAAHPAPVHIAPPSFPAGSQSLIVGRKMPSVPHQLLVCTTCVRIMAAQRQDSVACVP
jgi:hypothetical protein